MVDVTVQLQLAVKNDSKVMDVWGGRQSGVVKHEAEVLHSCRTGCGIHDDDG